MSLDHTVYVKTRTRSSRAVRAAATKVLSRYEGLRLAETEEWGDEDELWIEGLGGPIEISRRSFGLALTISTTTGAPRDRFVELGEMAEEIATAIGTVIDSDEAIALEEKAEASLATAPAPLPQRERKPAAAPTGPRVEIVLRAWGGDEIERATTTVALFEGQRLASGELASRRRDPKVPAILCEHGRIGREASFLECTQYGDDEAAVAKYNYELDRFGGIKRLLD